MNCMARSRSPWAALKRAPWACVAIFGIGVCAAETSTPIEPSTQAQVRVVQDMHTAPIDQIRADARFERLVTASSDKTLRIWRLADLQLLRKVPLPSEPGREGTPYSIAISADGQRAYAAGFTGWQWRHASHIYVVDAAMGRIVGALGRFEGDVVTALDLSPDGTRLAVGLGRGGLVVLATSNGARVFADPLYAAPVTFVHHAPDGRLASSASDGCLRVYAETGALLFRNQYPPLATAQPQCTGGELGGVRFSPDGRWLALGVRSSPEVGLFDGRTLELKRPVRARDPDQRSLCCIAWSPDSRTLFVNGNAKGDQPTPLYVIRDPLAGQMERWNVGRQQFTNMLPMPDGSIVFATTVPSLTRVGSNGRVMKRLDGRALSMEPDNVDFYRSSGKPDGFLVAGDGTSLLLELAPGHRMHVSPLELNQSKVLAPSAARSSQLLPARRAGAVSVEANANGVDQRKPARVNGQVVQLGFEERVQSWAVHPRLRVAALGTQWRVHLLDERARPMPGWEDPPFLLAPAYHTVITDDGRWVVVAVGDGTVHWYDVTSGKERLGMFIHANGSDWVAWRPDGFYASSPDGDRFVGWLVNRGFAQSPDFFQAVQFERELYRPDLVRTALSGNAGGRPLGKRLEQTLAELASPRVRIESIEPTADAGTASIRFSAESTGRPIQEVGVFVGGIPVLPASARAVSGNEMHRLTRTVLARLADGASDVRVEAETSRSLGIDESRPLRPPAPAAAEAPGTLWVVAVGVSRFEKVAGLRPLPFTSYDARDLAQALAKQKGRAFTDVRVTLLTENTGYTPDKASILDRLHDLGQMKPQDTAVVFISSHGTADSGDYYVATSNAEQADVQRVLDAQASGVSVKSGGVPSLLSGDELSRALRRLPGRRILILDTCHAGAAGTSNPYSLLKRSASAQIAVLSASRGDEYSFDSPSRRNGIFAGALVDVLNGHAPLGNGAMTLRQVFDATLPDVQEQVRELQRQASTSAERQAIHQTPILTAPASMDRWVIGHR